MTITSIKFIVNMAFSLVYFPAYVGVSPQYQEWLNKLNITRICGGEPLLKKYLILGKKILSAYAGVSLYEKGFNKKIGYYPHVRV